MFMQDKKLNINYIRFATCYIHFYKILIIFNIYSSYHADYASFASHGDSSFKKYLILRFR